MGEGSTPRRPHVVIVMTDQQKATAIDLYGGPVRTPQLRRLAASGLLYEHAFTPHPLCVPARVSMWTGRYPHSTGARTNETPMPRAEIHLAALLHEAGYTLGHFGKNHCFTPDDFDRYFRRVFQANHGDLFGDGITDVYTGPPTWPTRIDGIPRPVGHVRAEPPEASATYRVTEEAIRFLEEEGSAPDDHPLALWISIPDPHTPLQTPEPYASRYRPEDVPTPPWAANEWASKPARQQIYARLLGYDDLREDDVRLAASLYYGMIDFIDERIGAVLDTLERLGMREDTIVIFTADHGDYLGEHHLLGKSNAFYDCLMRIPMIVSWPSHLPAGERRPELVSLVDVMPTILRLLALPIPDGVQGRVLPGVTDAPAGRDAVFGEYGAGGPPVSMADAERLYPPGTIGPRPPLLREREGEGHAKMVRTHRWKYTYDTTDRDELYDLEADPWELTNLAGDARYAETVAELRLRLLDWCLETENARPVPLYFVPASERIDLIT
ncbi:MAG: sulfatase-like hydrolase/transferase [Chloroflexi bacterium]|nr:sulfatase-like hydrolase/transferase [Chloroflexota bacterium]